MRSTWIGQSIKNTLYKQMIPGYSMMWSYVTRARTACADYITNSNVSYTLFERPVQLLLYFSFSNKTIAFKKYRFCCVMISILFSESAPYNTPYSEEKAVPWEKIKTEKKAWDNTHFVQFFPRGQGSIWW